MSDKTPEDDYDNIIVSNGFGANTKLPFVTMESKHLDKPIQLSPEDAIGVGFNLIHAAEAAKTEQFLFEFLHKELGLELDYTYGVIKAYRKHSQDNWKPFTPSTPADGL